MDNFSVLLSDVGSSQLSFYAITEINKLSKTEPLIDGVLFYENISSSCMPANFSIMPISECWINTGPVVATCVSTASKLLSFPSEKKFFYVWDLEWIRNRQIKRYEDYLNVYTDESMSLIARSKPHAQIISNCFNRNVDYILSDFSAQEFLEIIGD